MKKVFKELFKEWKTWVILGCGLLNIVVSLYEKDWTEAMFCFLTTILCFVGSIQDIVIQKASEYIEQQDDLLMKADAIIKAQTEIIKDLEENVRNK